MAHREQLFVCVQVEWGVGATTALPPPAGGAGAEEGGGDEPGEGAHHSTASAGRHQQGGHIGGQGTEYINRNILLPRFSIVALP